MTTTHPASRRPLRISKAAMVAILTLVPLLLAGCIGTPIEDGAVPCAPEEVLRGEVWWNASTSRGNLSTVFEDAGWTIEDSTGWGAQLQTNESGEIRASVHFNGGVNGTMRLLFQAMSTQVETDEDARRTLEPFILPVADRLVPYVGEPVKDAYEGGNEFCDRA